MSAERFIHDGDHVAVLLRVSGRSPTGIPVEGEFGAFFAFRNGLVIRWEIYSDWARLLKAWERHQSEVKLAG